MDPLASKNDTEKECVSLKKHRQFVRCDIDRDCFDSALPGLLLVLRIQIVNIDSEITVDYNVEDAAWVYVEEMETAEK